MKKKVKLNEEQALFIECVYKEYYQLMFSVAKRYGFKNPDQEDVVSNVMVSLMNNAATLKSIPPDERQYYIIRTVISTSINHLKKQSTIIKVPDDHIPPANERDPVTDTEEIVSLRMELANVLSSIMSLPEKESQCIRLKYLFDRNNAQIAQMTGLSENSVNQYILRARKHIRSLLYGNGDDEQNG